VANPPLIAGTFDRKGGRAGVLAACPAIRSQKAVLGRGITLSAQADPTATIALVWASAEGQIQHLTISGGQPKTSSALA